MSSETPEPSVVPEQFGEYRFQDPAWMAWWLSSLYLLRPDEQVQIASRMLETVHAKGSQEMLIAFIEYHSPQTRQEAQNTGEMVEQTELDTEPSSWKGVLSRSWKNYSRSMTAAAVVLAFAAWRAVKALS
jgi:hypothetical protein